MKATIGVIVVLVYYCICITQAAGPPSYDHQQYTYTSHFRPVTVNDVGLDLSIFFSPDTSIDVETRMIQEAQSSIDLMTPGWDSWSGCTNFTGPQGCSVSHLRNSEQFPGFQAMVNAINRGVKVRIITNNYNSKLGPNLIDPLSFVTLQGAQTKFYKSTTFMHAKFMIVDGKVASVSSVNWDYTSFMENREAGIIVNTTGHSGSSASKLMSFLQSVYNYDFSNGGNWPTNTYSSSDMSIIHSKSHINVVIPHSRNYSGAYVTKTTTLSSTFNSVSLVTSPDYAFTTITTALNNTQSSLYVYIYQIEQGDFCNMLLSMISKSISLKILVSNRIFSKPDWESAHKCYTAIHAAGQNVRLTEADLYTYSHQKFWIIDQKQVWLSTGNWGETDYPDGSGTFPPYKGNESQWRDINRDFTIGVVGGGIVGVYNNVMDQDYQRGHDFKPYSLDELEPTYLSTDRAHITSD